MTERLDEAFERVPARPPETRDASARVPRRLAGDDDGDVCRPTSEEEADPIEARAEVERGEFAGDAEVEAVPSLYRA